MTSAPEPDLPSLLMQVGREMRRLKMSSLQPHGITPHQSRTLGVITRLADGQEIRPSVIAERLGIAPRSATEVIDALEERGLVERAPSPTDRRATVVRLTAAGRSLRARLERERATEAASYVSALSDEERRELVRLLQKLLGQ